MPPFGMRRRCAPSPPFARELRTDRSALRTPHIRAALVATLALTAVIPLSAGHRAAAALDPSCRDAAVLATAAGPVCTHGNDDQFLPGHAAAPDPDYDVADALVNAATTSKRSGPVAARAIPCHGDGTSGNRIAVYYAYLSGHKNRVSSVRNSLVTAVEQANDIVFRSAQQTGGKRWLRVLTDSKCVPVIGTIALPSSAAHDFGATISAATAAHLDASNRKYVLFVDTSAYCGIATLVYDDQPGVMNASNTGASWARIDTACWSGPTAAHEILHMLGAVQKTAPHQDGTGHCTDEHDLMCYQSPNGKKVTDRCTDTGQDYRLDCGKDDYFNTSPKAGSYLATHWNTAMSSFLYGGGPVRPVPPGPVSSTSATMDSLSSAVVRWAAPVNSRVTQYTVFGADGSVLWRGTGTSWTDNNAVNGQTGYRVQAANEAGAGPTSDAVTATLPPPPAPGDVAAAGSPPTVSWTQGSRLVAGFHLFGISSNGQAVQLRDQPSTSRSASDNTIPLLRSWNRYRVCAYNDAGQACTDQTS